MSKSMFNIPLYETFVNAALFVPFATALVLTIIDLIKGCREIYYTTYKQRKILSVGTCIFHSVCITLYFAILPMDVLNTNLNSNILATKTYGTFIICYNIWGLILISMYILQVVRGYVINLRYNFIFMLLLLGAFLALWLFLSMFQTQYFMNYVVSWFIIL
eukprot:248116_1